MRLVIVKKGALSTFRFLEQSCRDIAGLRVIWDRRSGQRRQASASDVYDRREADRRREPPHSWTAADHVLTNVQSEENVTVEPEPAPIDLFSRR